MPQSETGNGAAGFVMSISRKSPSPSASRYPLAVVLCRIAGGRNGRVRERTSEVGPVLHLELVHPARAAARVQQGELDRLGRVGHVPELEATLAFGLVAGAGARLDACHGDVTPRVGAVPGGVDNDVLGRAADRVVERGDLRWLGGIAGVDHGHAPGLVDRAEAGVAGRPVGEAPLADVGEAVVHPDVAVEAARTEIGVADCHHVPGRAALVAPSYTFSACSLKCWWSLMSPSPSSPWATAPATAIVSAAAATAGANQMRLINLFSPQSDP